MKKLLLLSFALLLNNASQAQTNISGTLSGTLALSGSPYLVQGHVLVAPNTSLQIDPGVVVQLKGHFKINVQGRLIARGNVTDSVTFMMDPAMQSTGWWGIRFEMTPSAQDSSIIEYCRISGAYSTGIGDDMKGGGIFIKSFSRVRVSHCLIFSNKAHYGAGISLHYTNARITNNRIINNTTIIGFSQVGGGGIYCDSLSQAYISNNEIAYNTMLSSGTGGGLACVNSSPYVAGNNIHHNVCDFSGGGVSMINGTTGTFLKNTISDNQAYSGGGVLIHFASPVLTENAITNNTVWASPGTQGHGGGIQTEGAGSTPTIERNNISFNYAPDGGGGIEVAGGCVVTVTGNTIHANRTNFGGGFYMFSSFANIENNIISNNFGGNGGGIFLGSASGRITGNVIVNNTSALNGGGIYLQSASPMITNCSIGNNYANTLPSYTTYLYGGAGLFCTAASNPTITNSIFWGNRAQSANGHQIYLEDNASDPPVINTVLDGGLPAIYTNGSVYSGTFTNNITSDPLFLAPSANTGSVSSGLLADWHVANASPCFNSGKADTTGLGLPLNDRDGNLRVKGYIDRGAYENPACGNFTVNTSVTVNGLTLSAPLSGKYQWLDCNLSNKPIAGQTNPAFTATANGRYSVQLTQFGCSDISACIAIDEVGVNGQLTAQVLLYPNPSAGFVHMKGLPPGNKRITVTDLRGRIIIEKITDAEEQDLALDSSGFYCVQVSTEEALLTRKLIIE